MSKSHPINESNKKAYNVIAKIYAGDIPTEDDPIMRLKCRSLFMDALPGKEVLEIGCGPGVDSSYFLKNGLSILATDFSEKFLEIVRERYPAMKTHQMDMTKPDLPEKAFDGIYAFASFIHIPRAMAKQTLQGFANLLREKGVLFLSLIQSTKHAEYIIENWGGEPNNPVLFTCYQPSEITMILKDVGFKDFNIHTIKSEIYENSPRLIERGVSHYQLVAIR